MFSEIIILFEKITFGISLNKTSDNWRPLFTSSISWGPSREIVTSTLSFKNQKACELEHQ